MNPDIAHDALLIFARNPQAGRVKTRLIGALGAQRAADVYARMLQHALTTARAAVQSDSVRVCIADPAPNSRLQPLLDRYRTPWVTQVGEDLGMRMHQAITDALQSATRVVLIGSDCPEYDTDYLASAFTALSTNDVVLGPAADGGYVLIGMKQPHPRLFSDMPWGSEHVCRLTRSRLSQLQLEWHELPIRHDVDTAADLARFPQLTACVPDPD